MWRSRTRLRRLMWRFVFAGSLVSAKSASVSENLGAKKVLHEMKIVCLINIRHNVTFVVTVASVEVRFASLAGPSFSGSFFSSSPSPSLMLRWFTLSPECRSASGRRSPMSHQTALIHRHELSAGYCRGATVTRRIVHFDSGRRQENTTRSSLISLLLDIARGWFEAV